MQTARTHRVIAALLAVVMVLGVMPATVFAAKGDDGTSEMNEAYEARESLMPIGPSFNVDTLLEWTPESDPDAMYSRASIKLKDRIGGFVVNPMANPEAKLMLCSMANTNHDNTNAQGSDDFFTYAFNYWQYTDSFVYWSGSQEGLVVCPTGEFTDAAHTNGVPVVATLGFPWGTGTGYVEQVREFVQKAEDGSFPVADKLIEVMDYYGFDGYFFNQESYGCGPEEGKLIDEMMRYMHKKRPDMLISWYDSMLPNGGVNYQDAVNDSNKQFMTPSADGTQAIDEFFMNYNWYESHVNTTINTMKSIGRSQFDAFAGFNVQANVYGDRLRDHLLVDEDGVTRLSLALYYANQTMTLAKDGENFHETEQAYYVNAKGDPRDTSVDVANPSEQTWAGMSRFFADKSPVTSAPFVTDFNTGHGKSFFVDGVKSKDTQWSYQSNQDVLPTWTWIIDSQGEKLTGGYDFNDAWNGGNSIKFSGKLTANKANDIMLYSTKVPVEKGMKLGLTYKGDQGKMKLVAYYGDETTESYEACEKVAYDLTAGKGEWITSSVDLSQAAGKTLYAIGLKIESAEDVADYQVNLGRLTLTEKKRPELSGPASVTLDELIYTDAYTAEARIFWNAVTGASSYEIYKVSGDKKTIIMETPNTAYYIPALVRDEGETNVTLEVVPVNRNGVRGKGTTLEIHWAYGDGDTDKIVYTQFDNVCLGATVTEYSEQGDGAECDKALDGTSSNGSKWWASGAGDWFSIDLGEEKTIKRWRVEHAEAGGEDKKMNTDTFTLEYKNAEGQWKNAKTISGNTDAITDVRLEEPITAREWKLRVDKIGPSSWSAVNIYEWQMFESDEFPMTRPTGMQFATAINRAGAKDSFTLKHVSVGQTVKVYTKNEKGYNLLAEAKATENTVTIDNLDFGTAEAGAVYYTTTSFAAEESTKLMAAFEAENAEKTAAAKDVTFEKYSHDGSNSSSNGNQIYTTMTVKNLKPGDVVYVYENGAEAEATKVSLPVAEGETSVSVSRVAVTRAGGDMTLRVKSQGKLISDAYTVKNQAFDEPTATVTIFAKNSNGESITGARYGVIDSQGQQVAEISTTSDSGGKANVKLGNYTIKCLGVPAGYEVDPTETKAFLRTEGWNYEYVMNVKGSAVADTYQITVAENLENGTITPSKTSAKAGETITVTVAPAEGFELVEGSLKFNNTPIENNSFVMPKENVVLTAEFKAVKVDFTQDIEAAKKAAETAQTASAEAQKAAEAAKAAADAAEASTAADKTAAEAAKKAAADAQTQVEAAKKAAESAKAAAEKIVKDAESNDAAAVKASRKAAEDAAKTAADAEKAAKAAAQTAQIQKEAQAAQAAAEEAEKIAAEAQTKADEAKKFADEAEKSTAVNKDAAQKAKAAAEAAQTAAADSKKAAEDAKAAAQTAKDAKDLAAAKAAAEAAKYAQETAEKYEKFAAMQAEIAEANLNAQNSQQQAEEAEKAEAAAKLAAAKFEALMNLTGAYDSSAYDLDGLVQIDAIVQAAKEEISAAASEEEVKTALDKALAAIAEVPQASQEHSFTDVEEGKWYSEAVQFVYEKGIMNGVTDTRFAPGNTMNRGMLVTTLYRMAGSPKVEGDVEFTDVDREAYYYDALVWAVQNKIVTGVTETKFAPGADVTREQIATFLYRYAQYMQMDTTAKGDLTGYADADQISTYAQEAMAWIVGAEIMEGVSETALVPGHNANRAQVATMLMRLAEFAK